jgi:hypothetical protein
MQWTERCPQRCRLAGWCYVYVCYVYVCHVYVYVYVCPERRHVRPLC